MGYAEKENERKQMDSKKQALMMSIKVARDLEDLKKHPGYQTLEMIQKDMEENVIGMLFRIKGSKNLADMHIANGKAAEVELQKIIATESLIKPESKLII